MLTWNDWFHRAFSTPEYDAEKKLLMPTNIKEIPWISRHVVWEVIEDSAKDAKRGDLGEILKQLN